MNSSSRLHRLAAELRQQLLTAARSSPPSTPASQLPPQPPIKGAIQAPGNSALFAVNALMASGVSDESILVKRYVEELLKTQFTAGISNDPEFHQALGALVEVLEEDRETWDLCLRCIRQ